MWLEGELVWDLGTGRITGILYPLHQVEDGHSDSAFPDFEPNKRKQHRYIHSCYGLNWNPSENIRWALQQVRGIDWEPYKIKQTGETLPAPAKHEIPPFSPKELRWQNYQERCSYNKWLGPGSLCILMGLWCFSWPQKNQDKQEEKGTQSQQAGQLVESVKWHHHQKWLSQGQVGDRWAPGLDS